MSDYIIRGMAADGQVRFFAGTTKEIVETARSIHNTSPVATAALGRLLTAGALMGAACKNDSDLLTLQIQCSGPIGGLTVTADAHCNVKGYVNNPEVILHANDKGKLDVAKALDMGVLSVIKDIGLKEPYIGQTQLVSGEIAVLLPGALGTAYPGFKATADTLLYICLGFIMINVGREFEIDKSRWRSYTADYFIAMATAALPWLLIVLYYIFVLLPSDLWTDSAAWKENLLLSRFAAPTSGSDSQR